MGFDFNHISSSGLLAIYVLAQFFFNFGKFSILFLKGG
jgi:PHS family inorganic phosphate transporter-like MFS transporter